MVFSSLIFLLLFLPVTLVVYHVLPHGARNAWLLVASLAFYAAGEPFFVFLFIAEIVWNWAFGLGVARHRDSRTGKALLVACLVGDLGMLAVFKYADFAVGTLNALSGASLPMPGIALPIGISFYTFQEISYVVDVFRGAEPQESPLSVGLYLSFFPQLIAGPIVRYTHIEPQLAHREVTLDDICDGMGRFCIGLCKKVLVANQLGMMVDIVFDKALPQATSPLLWLCALAYAMQIYLDFSGYSDMAIGLGRMFGFHLPENFDDPYRARSATDFWRRWHMSLSTWFRDYVYIPLGGSRNGDAATIRNLAIVWALTGLWHGAGWTFVLWGIGWGFLLILEKFIVKPDERSSAFQAVWRIAVLFFALLLWMLFRAASLEMAGQIIVGLLSPAAWMAREAGNAYASAWLHEEWLPIVAGIILCTGAPKKLLGRLACSEHASAARIASMLVLAALTVLALSYIVQGSYNPFLYFQF